MTFALSFISAPTLVRCQVTLALITLGAGEPHEWKCVKLSDVRAGVNVSHAGDTRQRHETRLGDQNCKQII